MGNSSSERSPAVSSSSEHSPVGCSSSEHSPVVSSSSCRTVFDVSTFGGSAYVQTQTLKGNDTVTQFYTHSLRHLEENPNNFH